MKKTPAARRPGFYLAPGGILDPLSGPLPMYRYADGGAGKGGALVEVMQQQVIPVAVPSRRPLSLVVVAVALVALGVLLTPSLLIALGPMRGSLTHENPLVRRTTLLEVNVLRGLCFAAGAVLLAVWARWDAFRNSRLVTGALEQPLDEADVERQRRYLNPSLVVMLVALAAWLAYVKLGTRLFSPHALSVINREDGVIEGGTALFFFIASVGSAVLAWKSPARMRRVFCAVLAIGFFMCMGEEMSWGQHLFGWKAPEAVSKVNVQAETNLHNLSGYFADHVFIAGTLLYGGIVPFVAARSLVWRRAFERFGIIVPSLGLAVGFILVTLNQPYLIGRVMGRTPVRIQEGRELLSALGYCLVLWEGLRAVRRAPVRSAAALRYAAA